MSITRVVWSEAVYRESVELRASLPSPTLSHCTDPTFTQPWMVDVAYWRLRNDHTCLTNSLVFNAVVVKKKIDFLGFNIFDLVRPCCQLLPDVDSWCAIFTDLSFILVWAECKTNMLYGFKGLLFFWIAISQFVRVSAVMLLLFGCIWKVSLVSTYTSLRTSWAQTLPNGGERQHLRPGH